MNEQESYYVGTDLKFELDITASGFDMAEDDYEITLVSNNRSYDVESKDIVTSTDGKQYLLVDTTKFPSGLIKMVVTAYVPDDDFPNAVRREVTKADLCYIKKP